MSWVFLLVGTVLFISQLRGCKRGWAILPDIALNAQGDWMVFLAGPAEAGGKRGMLDLNQTRAFVLDLTKSTREATEIERAKPAYTVAWRPGRPPAQLYVAVHDFTRNGPWTLMGIAISDSPSTVLSQELNARSSDIIDRLGWSPDGSVLAVASQLSGLRLSYDGGKTFTAPDHDIRGLDRFVWISSELLYAHQCHFDGDRILEIAIHKGQAEIKQTIATGKVRLCGSLAGEIVYRVANNICRGGNLFYASNGELGGVFADKSHIAFLEEEVQAKDRHVCILDKNGDLIYKKNVPSDTIVIGVSSSRECVYLLKDLRAIQTCSFAENDKISTIYTVW